MVVCRQRTKSKSSMDPNVKSSEDGGANSLQSEMIRKKTMVLWGNERVRRLEQGRDRRRRLDHQHGPRVFHDGACFWVHPYVLRVLQSVSLSLTSWTEVDGY